MRHYRAVRWLVLVVLAFSSGAFARTPALTYRAIMTMPPSEAGLRLLGVERGADIVRLSFIDLMNAGPDERRLPRLLQLFLYSRPVPLGSSFCVQQRQFLGLVSAQADQEIRGLRNDEPLRVLWGWKETTLARAPGCRLAPGQTFAGVQDRDVAMRALDDLAAAQEAARSPQRTVALQLTCDDAVEYDPDRCRGGGREALARLPLKGACRIDAIDGDPEVIEVTLCTGGPLWVLRLRARGRVPALSMLWKNADGNY